MYLFILSILLAAPARGADETAAEQSPGPAQAGVRPGGDGRSQAGLEKMREMMHKRELAELERLRSDDPEAYAAKKRELERREQVARILSDAREGRIAQDQAEEKLFPLMKDSLKPELEAMDGQIAGLEKRLAALKEAKKDPNSYIRRRIAEALGKAEPDPNAPRGMRP